MGDVSPFYLPIPNGGVVWGRNQLIFSSRNSYFGAFSLASGEHRPTIGLGEEF